MMLKSSLSFISSTSPIHARIFDGVLPPNSPEPVIVTHSGVFHADETMSCAILSLLPEFLTPAQFSVVRIGHALLRKDREAFEALRQRSFIVCDIGGEYDLSRKILDHHQRDFNETFSDEFETKLSSCGLVWKHFGKTVLNHLAAKEDLAGWNAFAAEKLHSHIYKNLLEGIDANDNGISRCDCENLRFSSPGLPARIRNLNVQWYETKTPELVHQRFLEAIQLARTWLIDDLSYCFLSWIPAKSLVSEMLQKSTHFDGRVLELTRYVPWKGAVRDLEEEQAQLQLGLDEEIEGEGEQSPKPVLVHPGRLQFAIHKDYDGSWRYTCMPARAGSFDLRIGSMPESWCGTRAEELSRVSGVPDCTFVHRSGFTGGNETKDGVLEMIRIALIKAGKWDEGGEEKEPDDLSLKRPREDDRDPDEPPAKKRKLA